MTDKVRQLAPAIWEEIQKADKILLHLHPGPDPDSAGSALALMHLLTDLGKKPTVIAGDSPLALSLSALPGYEKIITKNYFEINPSDYNLFIVLDSSKLNQISKKDNIIFPPELRTIKIDHHQGDDNYANINLSDTSYCATSHIVFDLMKEWKVNITPEIAGCLFAGIYNDTGGFKYPPTNSETLLAGSELVKIYPDYFRIIFQIENSKTPKQLEFLGLALSSIEQYFSGKVAVSAVSFEKIKQHQIPIEDSRNAEIPNILKSVIGWTIGIGFFERTPGVIEIGLRKREYEGPDLSILAAALGGGGHKAAAGGSIKLPFEEAKKTLIQKIAEVYPELGTP